MHVVLNHVVAQFCSEFVVFQSPSRCNEHVGRRLTHKSLNRHRWSQVLKILRYKTDVFFDIIDMERFFGIFLCEAGAADYLHLMYFQYVERQR